ncbi:MAG: M43 family zinc metalloprotease [Flavobacterium sp.]
MIRKLFFLTVLLLLSISNIFGQQLCHTPAQTNNGFLNKSSYLRSAFNNNSYCLKVYFHVIRRSDGTGGQTVAAVNQAFQLLNQDFNPHNISFSWDNSIDYINNTSYYNSPSSNIFTVNNHQDGIDIYLYDDNSSAGGLANGVGGSSEFYVSGKFWNSPFQSLITSHVISHEMGHVLFLWHTHHGTFPEGGNDNPCAELVNGSNASTCGDYVTDTPADPHIQFNVNTSCQWLGSGTDANGQSYNPDEQNIMAYTTPQCMSYFTQLQGLRMRNAIATLPYLQQCVVNCCSDTHADLFIKDSQDDTGAEPNTVTQYMWTSDNIWVRNYNDSGLTHQNPDYSALGNPNYVKVRVINKSCISSTGNEQLKLYWAKASTALGYPNPWFGGVNHPTTGASMGSPIGTLTIPVIPAGGETILTFPWQVPNPANYGNDGDQWHFCLLARIEATADPMTFPETGDLNGNVRNNNNIAWKNVTVVDVLPNNIVNPGGLVAVGNPFNHPKTFFLELEVADLETGKPIYQEAEVGIKMDDVLFNAWERGGKEAQLLDPTAEEKRKIVKGNNVIVDNISFNANEIGTLRLDFNFLTKELTDKTNYAYHVIQKDAETGQVIGGETFIINKNPRPIFEAEAPDKEVDLNQAITISAEDINEPAIYNWYDNDGNLIYQGKDLQVANAVAEKFKLEVIATSDGFKDYKEVEVKLKPSTLENIAPNPATNNVLVSYKLNGVSSAYLMVIGYYGSNGTSNNYILDTNSSETNLNVSNYASGFYTVALVVNGEIVDAKTLIKQ